MIELTYFIDREDVKKVEEEEKNRFVREIIANIGIPLDAVWPEDAEITVNLKIELRKLCAQHDIVILDDGDRGIEIYWEEGLIAKWYKPQYKLRVDNTKIEPSKKMFLEMTINFASVFEDGGEENVEND
ncbi:MAG TPA: hypothetical protein VKN14_03075 [Flavobacteriaceae bacterium]|nr:hypothetical protein [Flavobacteriaceae bacterium]